MKANVIELILNGVQHKLTLEGELVCLTSDIIQLATNIQNCKLVQYLAWYELQTDKWSVTLNTCAAMRVTELGIAFISCNDSPFAGYVRKNQNQQTQAHS